MTTTRTVRTAGPGAVALATEDVPGPGPRDALVRIRACGICGTDTFFVAAGGAPLPDGTVPIPLGHEPAGEVVALGAEVTGLAVGDHVVVNPMALCGGLLGVGGPMGAMRDLLPVPDAASGRALHRIDPAVPFPVAAPNALGQPRAATDVYLDAAGEPAVFTAVQAAAKRHARLAVVAVHKKPVDLSGILRSELSIVGSMGYPTEIFEVTPQLAAHRERFARIVSHEVPLGRVQEAFDLAATPGAADKVVVTLDD